jgi:hypothetical protein
MDSSCCIIDGQHLTVSTALGLPIHFAEIDSISRATQNKSCSDIQQDYCCANNTV